MATGYTRRRATLPTVTACKRIRQTFLCLAAALTLSCMPSAYGHTAADLSRGPIPGSAAPQLAAASRIAQDHCATCHGSTGNSPESQYPKLAGQNAAYLYAQLLAYKTGARKSDAMAPIVAPLSDSQLAELANFYAVQRAQPDPVKASGRAAAGRQIYLAGTGPGVEPPCVMCHGSSGPAPMTIGKMAAMSGMRRKQMHGIIADVPKLAGQHAQYVVEQLNRYADGRRPSIFMAQIAMSLSASDRKAVATYISSQP